MGRRKLQQRDPKPFRVPHQPTWARWPSLPPCGVLRRRPLITVELPCKSLGDARDREEHDARRTRSPRDAGDAGRAAEFTKEKRQMMTEVIILSDADSHRQRIQTSERALPALAPSQTPPPHRGIPCCPQEPLDRTCTGYPAHAIRSELARPAPARTPITAANGRSACSSFGCTTHAFRVAMGGGQRWEWQR